MDRCGVLVFSEKLAWAEGLVAFGRPIADNLKEKLGLLYISKNDPKNEGKEFASGVDVVLKWNGNDLNEFFPETLANGLFSISKSLQARVILIASSLLGKEVASRLAAALNGACVTECMNAYAEKNENEFHLVAEKSLFGGLVTAEIELRGESIICAVCLDNLVRPSESKSEVHLIPVSPDLSQLPKGQKEIRQIRPVQKSVDLSSAKRIVSIGRGCRKQEDVALMIELCQTLQAELGCSRPIAEELKWLPEERKVGLTGVSVKPDIYVAIGISGQIQHLAGMKDARLVVVINNDKKAPFFQAADYGVVGDLYAVVPELINALR